MHNFIESSVFLGVILSLLAYGIGIELKKRLRSAICNPLLIAIIITILVLLLFHIDYDTYYTGAKYLSYLLTPATICLAVPLYEQLTILKNNWKAILTGIFSGVLTSLLTVLALALLLRFDHKQYVTFLPKSITTAIGMDVSTELGGYVAITVAVIIITGVIGNVISETIFKLFHIEEPIARGIALGSSSHAIGTTKAMELGEVEGALSSLSIVVAGIITVAGASLFAGFL